MQFVTLSINVKKGVLYLWLVLFGPLIKYNGVFVGQKHLLRKSVNINKHIFTSIAYCTFTN